VASVPIVALSVAFVASVVLLSAGPVSSAEVVVGAVVAMVVELFESDMLAAVVVTVVVVNVTSSAPLEPPELPVLPLASPMLASSLHATKSNRAAHPRHVRAIVMVDLVGRPS
jgi:hypothetical protein